MNFHSFRNVKQTDIHWIEKESVEKREEVFMEVRKNCLFITTRVSLFANEVVPKVRVPFGHTYCDPEENIRRKFVGVAALG
jgi:hypothetical protein